MSRTRSALYPLARFLGDYQAVKNGRIGKRIARRAADRLHGGDHGVQARAAAAPEREVPHLI
jgi:hypothetical protein